MQPQTNTHLRTRFGHDIYSRIGQILFEETETPAILFECQSDQSPLPNIVRDMSHFSHTTSLMQQGAEWYYVHTIDGHSHNIDSGGPITFSARSSLDEFSQFMTGRNRLESWAIVVEDNTVRTIVLLDHENDTVRDRLTVQSR